MSENRNPVPALSATSDVPEQNAETTARAVVTETPVITTTETPVVAPLPVTSPEPSPRPVSERISQLVAQRREADARADRLEQALTRALAALEKPAVTTLTQPTTEALSTSSRPVRDSFGTPEDYEAALIDWAGTQAAERASSEFRRQQEEDVNQRAERARQEEETRQAEAARTEEEKKARELQTSWEIRRAKALEAHPDFAEVAESESIPVSIAMGHVIATRDDGPEIAYYLGKNPAEAVRIASLVVPGQVFPAGHPQAGLPVPNAIEQAFEMGKIAAKLGSASSVATPNSVSEAQTAVSASAVPVLPSPPNPISGANANATSRTIEEVGNEGSMEEYAARRTQQLMANRRPGQRTLLQ